MSAATCCTAVSAGRPGSAISFCDGRLQRLGAARHQDHVHAFAHQRLRAAEAQTLAGAAHQRPFARDTQIHTVPLMLGKSSS